MCEDAEKKRRQIMNPKFALVDTSSVSVISSRGIEEKPQRTLRVRLRFSSTPLLPSTDTSDAPFNTKFGMKKISTKEFNQKFENGEDISENLDSSKAVKVSDFEQKAFKTKKVNVDFPENI